MDALLHFDVLVAKIDLRHKQLPKTDLDFPKTHVSKTDDVDMNAAHQPKKQVTKTLNQNIGLATHP